MLSKAMDRNCRKNSTFGRSSYTCCFAYFLLAIIAVLIISYPRTWSVNFIMIIPPTDIPVGHSNLSTSSMITIPLLSARLPVADYIDIHHSTVSAEGIPQSTRVPDQKRGSTFSVGEIPLTSTRGPDHKRGSTFSVGVIHLSSTLGPDDKSGTTLSARGIPLTSPRVPDDTSSSTFSLRGTPLSSTRVRDGKIGSTFSTGGIHVSSTRLPDKKYRSTFWNYPFIRNFSMLLDHPAKCHGRNVSMVVGIISATSMFEERQIARSAPWFNGTTTFPVLSLFLLGRTDSASQQEEIEKENRKFGDIIQQNFTDAYRNLTYKVLMGMEWTKAHCPQAIWFMRLNIDHYGINISIIEDYTREQLANNSKAAAMEHYFVCPSILRGNTPFRNTTRWIASVDEYPESEYPSFCEGTSFMTPVKAINDILEMSAKTRFFWIEDLYITGIVRELIATIHLRSLSYDICLNGSDSQLIH